MDSGADMQREPTAPAGRKAEIRARLFSSEANDKIVPPPPPPKAPRPENDAPLLWWISAMFFLLGSAAGIASRYVILPGPLNPLEVMACFSFIASGVVAVWALSKVPGVKVNLIDFEERDD